MAARFRNEDRVRRQADFDRVYGARLFAADEVLVVNGAPNGLTHARLGLSISKRVGNAVMRNRWKRLIREAFRLSREQIPAGIDLVVRPQKGAVAELAAICASLVRLAKRVQGPGFRVQGGGGRSQRSEVRSQKSEGRSGKTGE